MPPAIVGVDCAALGVAEEDAGVGLPQEDALREVQLEEVRGRRFTGVRGTKWQGGCKKDMPSIPME